MKIKNKKLLIGGVTGLLLLVVLFVFLRTNLQNDFFLELKLEKEQIEVSSLDGDKSRQEAILGNLIVAYYSNDEERQWFRATEKEGVISGSRDNFSFTTEDEFTFVVKVSGTTVEVVVTKETATSAISFEIIEVAQGVSGDPTVLNSKPALGVGFDSDTSEEERNQIRQEAASDDNAVDIDENGNVIGIQQPENIWAADKAESLVEKGEGSVITSSPEQPKEEVIYQDSKGDYHLNEVRPESNPDKDSPSTDSSQKEETVEEKVPPIKEEEPEIKTNTYERVSVLVERRNVISAFSQNGGSGKLNLIVDSVSGTTYYCHDKNGSNYVITVNSGIVSFNGETYHY